MTPGSQHGNSLLSVLIGVGVVGIIGGFMAKRLELSRAGARHDELRDELQSVSDYLTAHLDCSKTLTGQACGGAPFQLIDAASTATHRIVIGTAGNGGWRIGTAQSGWYVRGTCDDAQINVEVARFKPDGTVYNDMLTNKPLDWKALTSYKVTGTPTCKPFYDHALLPPGCVANPSQTLTMCQGLSNANNPVCDGDPDHSYIGWAECAPGQIVTACGMSVGNASPAGGHDMFPVPPGSVAMSEPFPPGRVFHVFTGYGCICNYGDDLNMLCTDAILNTPNTTAYCQALCIAPPN